MMHHVIEYVCFGLYVILGPLTWVGCLVLMIAERRRMMEIQPENGIHPTPPVTILVPARDEEAGIRRGVESLLAQNYPDFKVIAIDDRSTDATGKILDEMAAQSDRLQVLHIEPAETPEGWTGKNHALDRGVKFADGEWLLFVDSDATLSSNALGEVLGMAIQKKADLVSLVPSLRTANVWEKMIGPLAGFFASVLDRGLHEPYAYGWFMLFRRGAYEKIGGHASVRQWLCEDKVLARRIKDAGMKPRVWWGSEYTSLHLDRQPRQIVHGLARNFYSMTPGRPWRAMACAAFILLCGLSGYIALFIGVERLARPAMRTMCWGFLLASIVHLGVMNDAVARLNRWSGDEKASYLRTLFTLPISLILSLLVFLEAIWMCFGGKVQWRGTVMTKPQPDRE